MTQESNKTMSECKKSKMIRMNNVANIISLSQKELDLLAMFVRVLKLKLAKMPQKLISDEDIGNIEFDLYALNIEEEVDKAIWRVLDRSFVIETLNKEHEKQIKELTDKLSKSMAEIEHLREENERLRKHNKGGSYWFGDKHIDFPDFPVFSDYPQYKSSFVTSSDAMDIVRDFLNKGK